MLLVSFFILGFMNVPIAVALGLSSCLCLTQFGLDMSILPTQVYSGIAKFVLLAVPFFILSGNVMEKSGISDKLIRFFKALIGHRKGGLIYVVVIASCFFAAISGSGPATVAALGIILVPAMINRGGFSAPFASALMASASSIAIVIPPSIAFVVYASITGVSVGDMFMGGIVPGIMMGLALVIIVTAKIMGAAEGKKKAAAQPAAAPAPVAAAPEKDDSEIVAIITSVICDELNADPSEIQISGIREA